MQIDYFLSLTSAQKLTVLLQDYPRYNVPLLCFCFCGALCVVFALTRSVTVFVDAVDPKTQNSEYHVHVALRTRLSILRAAKHVLHTGVSKLQHGASKLMRRACDAAFARTKPKASAFTARSHAPS